VTTEIIDTNVRVAAQKRSIKRMTELLNQAASISDIVAIESQLASRETVLESLVAQQAWLRDQTSLAVRRWSGPPIRLFPSANFPKQKQ
jgi:hypothetical protein